MNLKKIIFATSLGTTLEWAEFTVFAYMADKLASLFFCTTDFDLARLKIYFIFATSYLMRPLGAVMFGYIGDRYGRKPALIMALLLMALATFSIGVLPTYNAIGVMAPILLMVFRMIQGIAVGGEFSGAAVLLTEHDRNNAFLTGSWTPCAASCGMFIGSLAAYIVTLKFMPAWCWRIPFLLSSLIALIAIYLRKSMQETAVFRKLKQNKQLFVFPLYGAWQYNKKGLLCTASFALFISVFVYTGNIYYKNMLIHTGKINAQLAGSIITLGMMLTTLLIPVCAYLADQTNGYKICVYGLLVALFGSPLIMFCASTGNVWLAIFGQIIYAVADSMVSATMFTLLLQKFHTAAKYSGSSTAWAIVTAIFGGGTLLINEFLVGYCNFIYGPGIYMSISALICLIVVIFTIQFILSKKQPFVVFQ